MLGSICEADDAVQDAWIRLSCSGIHGIDNLGGWPTSVVARLCLDLLRSRQSRREEPSDTRAPEPASSNDGADPEPSRWADAVPEVGGHPRVVWEVVVRDDRIARIDMVAAADRLGELDLVLLGD